MDTALSDPRYSKFDSPEQGVDFDRMKEIRISGTLSNTKIPRGHFYLLDFNVGKDEAAIQTDISTEIQVYILRNAMKVRKWDQELDRNIIDSSEFRTFTDPVVLYDVNVIPSRIIAALPYTHKNPALPSIGGKGEKSLKRQYNLSVKYLHYVLYNGEICRMNVTATDNSGATPADKPLEFGKEAPDSFEGMRHSLDKEMRSKLYFYKVTLKGVDFSKKLVLKTFNTPELETDEEVKKEILDQLNDLYRRLSDSFWAKFSKALEATDTKTLDQWSKSIVEAIETKGTDTLLYSQNKEVNAMPQLKEGEVIDTPKLSMERKTDQSAVSDVAAELEGGETKSEVIDVASAAADVFPSSTAPAETSFQKVIKQAKNKKGGNGKVVSGKDAGDDGIEGGSSGRDNEAQ